MKETLNTKKELNIDIIKNDLLTECKKSNIFTIVFSAILTLILVICLIIYKWQIWMLAIILLDLISFAIFYAMSNNEKKYKAKIENNEFKIEEHKCLKKDSEQGDEEYRMDYYLDFGLEAEVEVSKSMYDNTDVGDEFYIVFINGDPDPRFFYNKKEWNFIKK